MALQDVSPQDIDEIVAIADVTQPEAVLLLKKYGSLSSTLEHYFDNAEEALRPPASAVQWELNDKPFQSDAADTIHTPGMSRPPSRVDRRHPTLPDFQPDSAAVVGMGQAFSGQSNDFEDDDMQRALEMSKQDLSVQETGVANITHFGPANRSDYDQSEWRMVTTTESREVIDHPSPAQRSRLTGEPAFLFGLQNTAYLASLLNILHSIPLAREALLLRGLNLSVYGHDSSWWSGSSDENTKALTPSATDPEARDRLVLLAEFQCLMAFLDGTDRAYGSVQALAELRALKTYPPEALISRVLQTWSDSATRQVPDDPLTQIFTSTAIRASRVSGEPNDERDLLCLEAPIDVTRNQRLIELLDMTIWADSPGKIDDIWMERCAPIFTIRLTDPRREGRGLNLEVPATWHADRYLYMHRRATLAMRQQMISLREEIQQASTLQFRYANSRGPHKRLIKVKEVLAAAAAVSGEDFETDREESDSSNVLPSFMSDASDHQLQLEKQLSVLVERIEKSVTDLETKKSNLIQELRKVANALTESDESADGTPLLKYVLQGVSTIPGVTYVRRPVGSTPDLINLEEDASIADEWQWWRITAPTDNRNTTAGQPVGVQHMSHTESALTPEAGCRPFSIVKVTEADVLDAAGTEHDSVLLVYATQEAVDFESSPASAALRRFVGQDNRAFQSEMSTFDNAKEQGEKNDTSPPIMDEAIESENELGEPGYRELTPMSVAEPSSARHHGPVYCDEPPPYATSGEPSPPSTKTNKIGMLAEDMMDKFSDQPLDTNGADSPIHIEHSTTPLR